MHFNENVQRERQRTADGELYYNVLYPKFKLGEEVVREVAVPPTYGKALLTLLLPNDLFPVDFTEPKK